jgi:ribosomal protein L40E
MRRKNDQIERKHLTCLRCGATMWTDAAHRTCRKCRRGNSRGRDVQVRHFSGIQENLPRW